jgi:hypothetical protein
MKLFKLSLLTLLTISSLAFAQNQSPNPSQMPNSVSSTPLPLAQHGPENLQGVTTVNFKIQAQINQADKSATVELVASNGNPNSTHLDAGGLSIDFVASPTVAQENALNASVQYHVRSVDTTTGKVFEKEGTVAVPFNQVTHVNFNEGNINLNIQKVVMQARTIN